MDETRKGAGSSQPLERADGSLYAVLTAAVAETLLWEGINPDGGFVIRSARAINTSEAKKLTTRDESLHAIIAAAVAKVLEDEGRDPEKGFTIHSVTAV